MIHLSGRKNEKISRALKEIELYRQEGLDGAIIEDYHGRPKDVKKTLGRTATYGEDIAIGVNLLKNPYLGIEWASEYGARFVQFDSIQSNVLNSSEYRRLREKHSDIAVLGGVRFKYQPEGDNPLEEDLQRAKNICEAVVTTGKGTGRETPLEKLKRFKNNLGESPLIVGAGVNANNVEEQLKVADGAIIGSYFKKNGKTENQVNRKRVRELINKVRALK